jgi:hypothetical protein
MVYAQPVIVSICGQCRQLCFKATDLHPGVCPRPADRGQRCSPSTVILVWIRRVDHQGTSAHRFVCSGLYDSFREIICA